MIGKIEVLVHPFDYENDEKNPEFELVRERKLLNKNDVAILTCDPDKVKGILGARPANIITVWDYSAEPMSGWMEYNQIVSNYSEVIISGGELKLDAEGNPLDGCVMHAYEETIHNNKRIDISACWIGKK